MKKIISIVFVLVLLGVNSGVVFAGIEDLENEDAFGLGCTLQCGEGEVLVFDECKCKNFNEAQCEIAMEESPGKFEYDSSKKECISLATKCESKPGYKWSDKSNQCLEGKSYCSTEHGDGWIYDPGSGICYEEGVHQGTILPNTELKESQCEILFRYEATHPGILKKVVEEGKKAVLSGFSPGAGSSSEVSPLDVLACGIKTGRMTLWMVPYYIKYLIQFALSIAGLVAIGSIIIGGYFYLFGAMIDDKDKGKRAIIYGLLGFTVAILAWAIVNITISLLTR